MYKNYLQPFEFSWHCPFKYSVLGGGGVYKHVAEVVGTSNLYIKIICSPLKSFDTVPLSFYCYTMILKDRAYVGTSSAAFLFFFHVRFHIVFNLKDYSGLKGQCHEILEGCKQI